MRNWSQPPSEYAARPNQRADCEDLQWRDVQRVCRHLAIPCSQVGRI